jgi:hypothetical protein
MKGVHTEYAVVMREYQDDFRHQIGVVVVGGGRCIGFGSLDPELHGAVAGAGDHTVLSCSRKEAYSASITLFILGHVLSSNVVTLMEFGCDRGCEQSSRYRSSSSLIDDTELSPGS